VKAAIVKQRKQRQVISLKVSLSGDPTLSGQSLSKVDGGAYLGGVFDDTIGQPYFVKQHSQITNFRRDTSVPDGTALTCVHSSISAISREGARLVSANGCSGRIIVAVDLGLKETPLQEVRIVTGLRSLEVDVRPGAFLEVFLEQLFLA
jgi:hypothetical protein